MKAIRIILMVLIIIGIGLLATQKVWVPRLVEYILAKEGTASVTLIESESQANMSLLSRRQCYTYSHEGTKDAPYTVHEFIDMTVDNGVISGKKTGTQTGPDMTNGYEGTLIGTVDKDTITAVFSYTVEGSKNKEKEIYKTGKTGIEKLRYPLTEGNGMLIPDTTKDATHMLYSRVECKGAN
jgi:uncharacterized protein YxeA